MLRNIRVLNVRVKEIFVLYDNLTHVQLRNTYVENILCV